MPAARKPTAKKSKSKAKSKIKLKSKSKAVAKPKAKPKIVVKPKSKPRIKAVSKPAPAPKKPAPRPRAKKAAPGMMANHLVAARLLRHSAELFLAVGKQNPKAEKTMILRAKIIETTADRVEADPMGGFEPIEGDEL